MLTSDDLPSHFSCGTIGFWGRSKVNIIFAEREGHYVDLRSTMLTLISLFLFCFFDLFLFYYLVVFLWLLLCLVVLLLLWLLSWLLCCFLICLVFVVWICCCCCCLVGFGVVVLFLLFGFVVVVGLSLLVVLVGFCFVVVVLFCCFVVFVVTVSRSSLPWELQHHIHTNNDNGETIFVQDLGVHLKKEIQKGAVLQGEPGCKKGLETFVWYVSD